MQQGISAQTVEQHNAIPRLGFHEIVPGDPDRETAFDHAGHVPQFDLDSHHMADYRRLVSARRKGPAQRAQRSGQMNRTNAAVAPVHSSRIRARSMHRDPMIQELVLRDINALIQGQKVFV